jgi:hypothetical protein
VVRSDVEGASSVGECTSVYVGVVKGDCGGAVGGNENALHGSCEGDLKDGSDVGGGRGVEAEIGAIGEVFLGGMVCEVKGEGCGAVGLVLKLCIFSSILVEEGEKQVLGGYSSAVSCDAREGLWVWGQNEYSGEAGVHDSTRCLGRVNEWGGCS